MEEEIAQDQAIEIAYRTGYGQALKDLGLSESDMEKILKWRLQIKKDNWRFRLEKIKDF